MGNLGSSKEFFVLSINPECWPNAILKFKFFKIFLKLLLYSPKD